MAISLKEVYTTRANSKEDQVSAAVAVREQVDYEKFAEFVGEMALNDYHALDEDELFSDYLECIYPGDISFYLGTYRGHPIASLKFMHEDVVFTPNGLDPYSLPNIGSKAEHVIKLVNREPHGIVSDDLAGLLVVHGTTEENAAGIMANGVDMNELNVGHLGKALYTTTEYRLALGYSSSGGKIILAQIKPDAVIIRDTDPMYSEVEPYMPRDDFPEILKKRGIDGIFCAAMSSVAIHNPNALTIINSFDAESLIKMSKKSDHDSAGLSR
ncbi:hypothetical protein D3C87_465960 [compost metagenome]